MLCSSLSIRSAAVLPIALCAAAASAQYHVIDPLPGDQYVNIRGISRDGNVVFGTSTPYFLQHPLKWSPSTGTVALAMPPGYAGASPICSNADGSVLGGSAQYEVSPNYYSDVAMRWTPTGVAPLAFIEPSFPSGDPFFCSPDGSVLYGTAWDHNFSPFLPAKWDSTGIHLVPDALGQFSGVSDDGTVMCGTYVVGNDLRGWVLTPAGVQTLPSLSAIHPTSYVTGVSGDGTTISGTAQDDAGIYTPVRWTSAGIQELSGVGPKVYGGSAGAITTDGRTIMTSSEGKMCIWAEGSGTALFRDYLTSHGVLGLEDVQALYPFTMNADATAFTGQLLDDTGYQFFYIKIGDPDTAPHAYAGPDQSRPTGSLITLDGTGTYDAEGGVLKYKWMEGATILGTTPTLDLYLSAGHHEVTLTVTDSAHLKATDTVNIDLATDAPPVVTLNGDPQMVVNYGSTFSDPGATANDDKDGPLPVTVLGSVNSTAVGSYTLTYQATDSSNHTVSVSRVVMVVYSWSGFLQPINTDGSSIFKLGSTIPVKFVLTGGASNLSIMAHLYVAKLSGSVIGTEMEAVSTAAADSGNTFRNTSQTYIFNLSTKPLTPGTWQLRVDLGDGVNHTVVVSLKP